MNDPVDPLIVASSVLNASVDARVRADRVGHQIGSPLVLVALSGLDRAIRDRLEVADYSAHCYGPTKHEALTLALKARRAILNADLHAVDGVVINDTRVSGFYDFPDEDSREQRFLLNFTLFYYETGEN